MRLVVHLDRVNMKTRKGIQECSAQFTATLARGVMAKLEPDNEQLAALPMPIERACRGMIADRAVTQMAVETEIFDGAALFDGDTKRVEWERSVAMERVRVKKKEDKNHFAQVLISFSVTMDEQESWPARDLVGKWLKFAGRVSK